MAEIIPITDPEDPRIAAYRDVRERDLVGRQGLFIAEGEVVVRVLLQQVRHEALSLLVAEKRLPRIAALIEGLADAPPVYAASQAVMDRIAGFPMHRGILALGRRALPPRPADLLAACPPRSVVVAVLGIANHDNVGGIFRNAAAFGADAVLLDAGCCDPLYRKAIRVSVGAALRVPFARFAAGDDVLRVLEGAGFGCVALSPGGAIPLRQLVRGGRVAVLFGSEGAGLPEDVLAQATSVRISMAAGFDSLNVATASGIVLHHLSDQEKG